MGEPGDQNRATRTPLAVYETLRAIALEEYPSVVADAVIERSPGDAPRNLRVLLVDDGFLDVYLAEGTYSYHWQDADEVVRFDNAPHHQHVHTHPHHRHVDEAVEESPLVGDPIADFRSVMDFLWDERMQ